MNYLSHYFIDHQQGNHYFNAALFLPDFARNTARGFDNKWIDFSEPEIQLQLGCLAHLNADLIFHQSDFFKKYSKIFSDEMNQFEHLKHLKRKWFFSHILFEMMLDRLIVKHFENTCKLFYQDLEKINNEILFQFVLRYTNKPIEPFIKNFEHFCEAKYLFGYAVNDSFIYSLSRVYFYGTKTMLHFADKWALKLFVNLLEEKYFNQPMVIIAELKQVFEKKII